MDPLFQASHSSHTTTSIKSQHSESTGVQKETSVKLKENRPVSNDILKDLSLLINDEWLAVGKFLNIPEKNLPKIHTDCGARQKEATYSMLLSWKEEMGNNATYDTLTKALKEAGRDDLAHLSTELIDSQEQLLIMEELLKRQQRIVDLTKRRVAEKTFLPSSESYNLTKRRMAEKTFLPSSESYSIQVKDLTKHGMAEKTSLPSSESHNLTKHRMAEKTSLPSSESYSMQQDLLLAIEENIRCQERLINLNKRELEMEEEIFLSWHIYDLHEKLLFAIEENSRCQERLIAIHKHRLNMVNKPFLPSSELHDLQESLILSIEFLNCQERFTEKRVLEMEKEPFLPSGLRDFFQRRLSNMKEELHRLKGLLELEALKFKKENQPSLPSKSPEPEIIEFKKENQPSLPSKSPELEILEFKKENQPSLPSKSPDLGKHELTMEKKTFVPSESVDKLGHFIRCLKAKYTTWVKSLRNTPWMKSVKLNIEDLFVDVDLLLWHPSQSTMSPSSWQPLYGFQDLFTHSELRRTHYITVEGESGSGKTVLLHRMVHSWCMNESFTQDVKLFILLPWSCIYKNYPEKYSLCVAIKRFLLPKNTFLTVRDVRNILTNTKSILALDDTSPYDVKRILGTDLAELSGVIHKDMRDLVAVEKLQLICFTSVNTNSLYIPKISNMTVKLQKWHKKQQLSYLQKLLPKDDKTHELILKRLGENSTLVNACGNPFFYVLFVHLLTDDLVCEKDVTIQNLWQLLKSTFKNLNKNAMTNPVQKGEESETKPYLLRSTFLYLTKYTIPKPVEDEKETETIFYPQGISKAAYECFRENEWQICYRGNERDYQTLEDLGILVKDQKDCFNRLSTPYIMSATVMTHRSVRFRFCHKIFHLWFAALYLSECPSVRKEYDGLFSPKHSPYWPTSQTQSTDKALLRRFICGLNSECSIILLENLARGRYADNNDDDEHFFLCLNEYCGDDDSLRAVVNTICQRKREFKLVCSNKLVLKSMTRIFYLATQWKIPIECIDLRSHDLVNVNEDGLTLSNGVQLGPLSAKEMKINKWCGKQLADFLNKCVHLAKMRIFASYPGLPHEIQREVEGATYDVYWNKSDEACYILEEGKWKFVHAEEETGLFQHPLCKEVYVDSKGASIIFEKASVSLHIPEGALTEGKNISITIVSDLDVELPLDNSLPMISPIVKCEPCGLKFRKPVTLVLPHCGIAEDINNIDAVFFRGDCSGKTIKWEMIEGEDLSVSETECCVPVTHFCFFFCKVKKLKAKRMRAVPFTRLIHGEPNIKVKLWICNDYDSTFEEIKEDEINTGYTRAGAWQNFTIYRSLGSIEVDCRRHHDETGTIHFNNIWRGSRGAAVFLFPITDGIIDETLYVKQIDNDDTSTIEFDIVYEAPKKSTSRKRKHTYQFTSDIKLPPVKKSKVTDNSTTLCGVPNKTDFKEQRCKSKGQLDQPGCSGLGAAKIPKRRTRKMKAYKAARKRRKRGHNSTDSTTDDQQGPSISESRNSESGSSKTASTSQGRNELKGFNESDVVSGISLWKLSASLPSNWEDLGRALRLTDDHLKNIQKDYQGKVKEMIYQMLLLWKQKNGRKATYGHLFKKLKEVGRVDLVHFPKWIDNETKDSEMEITR